MLRVKSRMEQRGPANGTRGAITPSGAARKSFPEGSSTNGRGLCGCKRHSGRGNVHALNNNLHDVRDAMLTSKKQEWILKMIKGPDIVPVGNWAGHYTSKSVVSISTEEQKIKITPADILDLSNAQYLYVDQGEHKHAIAWDRIVDLVLEEQDETQPVLQPHVSSLANRILSIPLGKKAG
jgi:hypothetical protein